MTVQLRLFTLEGPFKVHDVQELPNVDEARLVAQCYAERGGFTRICFVDDEDFSIRVTATTPDNRAGRNVAVIELGWN